MIVSREQMIRAVEILSLIPQRAGIPPSEYIKIEPRKKKLHLFLSSDALGRIEVDIDGTWPVSSPYFVDRSLFMPFVTAAKNMSSTKDFVFEDAGESVLRIRHGRRKVVLSPLPSVTGYGKIEEEEGSTELSLSERQKEIIQCAGPCATTDPISPHLNCVFMTEDGLVMASNQIVIFSGQTKRFATTIPMPLYMLQLLALDGVEKLIFSKKQVIMKLDCGEILQTVTHQALKKFPTATIIERIAASKKYTKAMSLDAAKLSEVLQRFATYMASVRRQDKVIMLRARQGKSDLIISAQIAAVKLTETMKMPSPAMMDLKAEWALEMVQPVIAFLGAKKKRLVVSYKKGAPYFIDADDVKLLLAQKVS